MTTLTKQALPTKNDDVLEEVSLITKMMREHQKQIASLSKKRAAKVMKLRENKVTYRQIAEAMGTTEQSVYNIIRSEA